MAKRKKSEHDFAVTAFKIVQQATGEKQPEPPKPRKDYDYKTLGKAGGLKGGKARASVSVKNHVKTRGIHGLSNSKDDIQSAG